MRCHARLGFERHNNGAYGSPDKFRKRLQHTALGTCQFDIITRGDTGQGVVGGGPAGSAKYEIEVFLTIVHKVPHFVIDAEAHSANFDMSSQKWRRREEIKDDTPTCDFRMMVTA